MPPRAQRAEPKTAPVKAVPVMPRPLTLWALRGWRKHRGYTQVQLAERAQVSQGMISQLEGDQSDFTGDLLTRLSGALECHPCDLLTRNPQESESIWVIWDKLQPDQQKQGLRLLKALFDEKAA